MVQKKQNNTNIVKLEAPRRMSRDPLRSKVRREEVFDAVARVLAKRRQGNVTLDSVALELGGSTGTLYYYFKSKSDMLYQLHMYGFDVIEALVNPILDDKTIPPRARLDKALRTHIMCLCNRCELWRSLLIDPVLQNISPGHMRAITRRLNKYEMGISDLAAQVVAAEGYSIGPQIATRLIMGCITSIAGWYKRGGQLSPEDVAEQVTRNLFHGFFPLSKS